LFIVTNKSHSALNGRLCCKASARLSPSSGGSRSIREERALNARLVPKLRASSGTNESVCDAKQTRQSRELMSESLAISSFRLSVTASRSCVVVGLRSETTTLPLLMNGRFIFESESFPPPAPTFPLQLLILTRASIPSVVLADDAISFSARNHALTHAHLRVGRIVIHSSASIPEIG